MEGSPSKGFAKKHIITKEIGGDTLCVTPADHCTIGLVAKYCRIPEKYSCKEFDRDGKENVHPVRKNLTLT